MSSFLSYREGSRSNWGKTCIGPDDKSLDREQIQLGALLRIADASEAMATNFVSLQNENKRLKESNGFLQERLSKYEKRISSLKGVITKLKNKMTSDLASVQKGEDKGAGRG